MTRNFNFINCASIKLFWQLLLVPMWISAQEIKVTDIYLIPGDDSAQTSQVYDGNDALCALLKIKTNDIQGLEFPNKNQYVKAEYKDDIYWVYIPELSYRLTFVHPDYQQGIIDLSEFGFKKNLKGGKTYEVKLYAPIKKNGNYVSIRVEPVVPGCKVILNGNVEIMPDGGVLDIPCIPGVYRLRVEAMDYEPYSSQITIEKGVVPVYVQLQPSTTPVKIVSNVKASVYVDNAYYGGTGILHIPIGTHTIRLSAEGYIDKTSKVEISSKTDIFDFRLEKNKGKVFDIHPVRVVVHCKSKKLYKNNKEISGWYDGATILLMPGEKCKLTDDEGHGAVLKVEHMPMEIVIEGNKINKI